MLIGSMPHPGGRSTGEGTAAVSHIGLDLDNTIIDYAEAFVAVGVRYGLLPADRKIQSKSGAKDFLLAKPEGKRDWMRLQGLVYGPEIEGARLYDGVYEFIHEAARRGHRLSIVSHKTEKGHFDTTGTNLREAALSFLGSHGLVGDDNIIGARDVHFLSSREAKLRRIQEIGCDLFVDDLVAVLRHPNFPQNTKPVWFTETASEQDGLVSCGSWYHARALLL